MAGEYDMMNTEVMLQGETPAVGTSEATPGRFDFLGDPNIQQAMFTAGRALSAGKPMGEVLGAAGSEYGRNVALQKNVAQQSQERQSLLGDIRDALKADPTGKKLLGPKEDMDTLDSITMTNDGINIKAPNADRTMPFNDLQDASPENIVPTGQDLRDFQ